MVVYAMFVFLLRGVLPTYLCHLCVVTACARVATARIKTNGESHAILFIRALRTISYFPIK